MVNRESRTLQRILLTGTINSKRICDASLADLDAENRGSQSEIIAEKLEESRSEVDADGKLIPIAHIITVYENDAVRTLKALKQVLSEGDLLMIREMI